MTSRVSHIHAKGSTPAATRSMEDVGQRTTSGTTGDGGSTTGSSSRNGGLARSWGDLAPTAENEADGGLAEAVDKKEPGEDQPPGVARCRENEVPETVQGASDATDDQPGSHRSSEEFLKGVSVMKEQLDRSPSRGPAISPRRPFGEMRVTTIFDQQFASDSGLP